METATTHTSPTQESLRHKYYPHFLFIVFLALWGWMAISPLYRESWWLENILVFLFVPFLIWMHAKFRLSNVSYTVIFVFLVLHTIGAHYTYAEVPFGFWLQEVLGFSRNHFDRIVHFSFGFLLAYPVREIFLRVATTKGFWGYWLPFELTLAFSGLFEIFEWWVVALTNPTAGSAYLGTQGDEWDAQKDMALAGLGAILAMGVTAWFKWRYDRRFKEEIKESFEVKEAEPLGEVKLAELKAEMQEEVAEAKAVPTAPAPAVVIRKKAAKKSVKNAAQKPAKRK